MVFILASLFAEQRYIQSNGKQTILRSNESKEKKYEQQQSNFNLVDGFASLGSWNISIRCSQSNFDSFVKLEEMIILLISNKLLIKRYIAQISFLCFFFLFLGFHEYVSD